MLLSLGIFSLLLLFLVTAFVFGSENDSIVGRRSRALFVAEGSLEAVRSIRDESFSSLTVGTHGLATSSTGFSLSGSSDSVDIFTRSVSIADLDSNTKIATATVTWNELFGRDGIITLTTQFTDWRRALGLSELFLVNTSAVMAGPPGSRNIVGIDLENQNVSTSTITEAVFTWSVPSRRIRVVEIDGVVVWSSGGVGSPSGNQPSGVTLDIVDVDIGPSTTVDIDRLNFNGCMRGTNFTAVFTFSDASSTSTSFSTGGGCGGGK